MDTFVLNALTQELRSRICSARIQGVRQPDAHTLALDLWRQGESMSLTASIAPQHQYLFLTADPPKDQGLGVGKFLQYHLRGAEVREIETPLLERIITLTLLKRDIDGTPIEFHLILEFMGRHSNIILVAGDSGNILESLRHVTAAHSSYRRVAPGARYVPPPSQDKRDPTRLTADDVDRLIAAYDAEAGPPLWKYLLRQIQGLSPTLAKELAADPDDAAGRRQTWSQILDRVASARYAPHELFATDDPEHTRPIGVSAFALRHAACAPAPSMLHAIEHLYRAAIAHQEIQSLRGTLQNSLRARLTKLRKKQRRLQDQEQEAERADDYKQQGDLLTANLHEIRKGMSEIRVLNYYSDDQSWLTIPLNPSLTPAQNAQRYFTRYSKLKQGKAITQERLQHTGQQIAYLEEWLYFVETAQTIGQLRELRQEIDAVFGRGKRSNTRSKPSSSSARKQAYRRFTSSDGFAIYVGRSSRENDQLTQRAARPNDIWLHAQGAPGSHVLILAHDAASEVPERTLLEAAALAAHYSTLRSSGKVDVMYTPRKYVKKPKGAPPGLVTVTRHHTLLVAPRADISRSDAT